MSEYKLKLVEELTNKGYETVIQYHGNGSIYYQIWYLNGKHHREDGPACIGYYKNGNLRFKEYYLNGVWHREDGPAYIDYNEDGSIVNISWKINGKHHREDGPAWIRYYKDNTISKSWDLNDKQLHKEDFTSFEMVERMQAHSLFTIKELISLKRLDKPK